MQSSKSSSRRSQQVEPENGPLFDSCSMDIFRWLKISLLLLSLLGGTALAEYGWRPKQEYNFAMEGRTIAGVTSLGNQYTGIHYSGTLKVQSQSANVLAMAFQNMTYIKLNDDLDLGWWDTYPDNRVERLNFPITDSTIILKLRKGMMEGLTANRNLPDWQMNFIQGVASKLQLDLSGSSIMQENSNKANNMHSRGNRGAKASDVFFAMEDSVTGRCEVLYQISPLPRLKNELAQELCGSRPFLEITKTLNHSNCELNPEFHFGLPHTLKCEPSGNQCGEFWTRSTVSQTIGCGSREDMLFLNSATSSRIIANLNFHNDSQASVNSYLNLTLISASPLRKKLPLPENSKTIRNLMYRFTNQYNESNSKKSKNEQMKKSDMEMSKSSEESKKSRHKRKASKNMNPSPPKESSETEINFPGMLVNSSEKGLWSHPKKDDILPPPMPFDGFALAHKNVEERSCLGQQLKEMVTDIASDLEMWDLSLEHLTLEKIVLTTRVCRSMAHDDLIKTLGIHMDSQVRDNKILMTERKVFRDIITMCGTNPAFLIIKSWIEERKVKGEEAISIMGSLPLYLMSPNANTIHQFYEMIRSSAVTEDPKLRTSAILAFSNLLRTSCISRRERQYRYPYHVIGEQCNAARAAKYVPYLASQLRGDPALRPAILMALGNTGSRFALPPLRSVVNDHSASPYIRARAIIAMKHLVLEEPHTMAQILLSFYNNKQFPEIVRLSAVSMLFFSKPPLSMLQSIAMGTWYEPSRVIQTFIYTSLEAFSQSHDPSTIKTSKAAASVLKLVKPTPFPTTHRAQNHLITSLMGDMQNLLSTHISWSNILSGSNFYMRHTSRISGFSRVGLETDFWVANPTAFIQGMKEFFYHKEDISASRPPLESLAHSTRWIKETLKIAPRTGPKLEGDLTIRMNKLVERMFVFNKGLFADLRKSGNRFLDQLGRGKTFHKQSMDNSRFEISTTTDMGFPVSFRIDNPRMLRITGAANVSRDSSVHQFTTDLTVLYGDNLQSELSFYTPFDETQHVAAHYSQRLLKPPAIRFNAGLNSLGDGLKISMWPLKALDHPLKLYHEIEKPFTAQRNVIQFTTSGLSKNSKDIRAEFVASSEIASINPLKVKFQRDIPDSEGSKLTWDSSRPFSIFGFSTLWPDLSACNIEATLDHVPPVTLEFGMGKADVKGNDLKVMQLKPSSSNEKSSTNENSSGERHSEEETSMPPTTTTETSTSKYTTESTTQSSVTPTHTTTNGDTTTVSEITTTPTSTPITTATTTTTTNSTTRMTTTDTTMTDMTSVTPKETSHNEQNRDVFTPKEKVIKFYRMVKTDQNGPFNASTMNLSEYEQNGRRIDYLLRNLLGGIESGTALAGGILVNIEGPEPRKYGVYMGFGSEISERLQRAGLFLVSQGEEQSNYGVTASLTSPASPVMNLEEILKGGFHSNLNLDISYPGKEPISVRGYMLRSTEKSSLLEKEPVRSCLSNAVHLQPECREVARKYSTLDLYNFTFLSKDAVQRIADSYMIGKMRQWYYSYMSDEKVIGLSTVDRANIAVEICPEKNCANIVMRLPDRNIRFDHTPTNPVVIHNLLVNPVFGPFPSLMDQSYCSLERNRIVTFDEAMYNYRFENCWHVLAKDCSGMSRIAILAKNSHNFTELEVNLDNYRVLRLKRGPVAEVNGQPVTIDQDQVAEVADLSGTRLMVFTNTGENAIEVKLPAHGFNILYGDVGVVITANSNYRGKLCGLCGDYNGDETNEMMKAGGEMATTFDDFAQSYTLSAETCNRDNKSE